MTTFKLLAGSHNHGGKTFDRGDLVESDLPLDRKFPGKFVKYDPSIHDEAEETMSISVGKDTLDSMTVAELKRIARDEEIDLGGATRKEEILAVLRQNVS